MGKIANWSKVNSRIGSTGSPAAKCPTKKDIVATKKGVVRGIYSNEQVVQLTDISKQGTLSGSFYVSNNAWDYSCKWMFDCENNGGEGENLTEYGTYVGSIDYIDLNPDWRDSTSYSVRISVFDDAWIILNSGDPKTYLKDKKCDVDVYYTDESGVSHKDTYTNVLYEEIDYQVTGNNLNVVVNVKL